MVKRRWYDKDPLLNEALELLSLSPDNTKNQAADFILKLQEEVAAEVKNAHIQVRYCKSEFESTSETVEKAQKAYVSIPQTG